MEHRSFLKHTALSAAVLALSGTSVFGARTKQANNESKVPNLRQ